MRIKSGLVKRKIAGRTVIVPLGDASRSFKGMIELNETAEFIWDRICDGFSSEKIAELLCAEYNVTHEKAINDTNKIFETIKKADLSEEQE